MRKNRIFIVAFVMIATILLLPSCSYFADDVESLWEYSADGTAEIQNNFALFDQNKDGACNFNITINRNGNVTYFNLDYSSYNFDNIFHKKYTYKSGSDKMSKLTINDADYYIDDAKELVYTSYDASFDKMNNSLLYVNDYGIINTSKMNWSFVKKTENVSITKSDGKSDKAIEYSYKRTEKDDSSTSTNLFVDFKPKAKTPIILRIYYEVYKSKALYETITIYYKALDDVEISKDDFAIPTFK